MAEWDDLPQRDPVALLEALEACLAEADAIGLPGTGARLSGTIDLLRIELLALDGGAVRPLRG